MSHLTVISRSRLNSLSWPNSLLRWDRPCTGPYMQVADEIRIRIHLLDFLKGSRHLGGGYMSMVWNLTMVAENDVHFYAGKSVGQTYTPDFILRLPSVSIGNLEKRIVPNYLHEWLSSHCRLIPSHCPLIHRTCPVDSQLAGPESFLHIAIMQAKPDPRGGFPSDIWDLRISPHGKKVDLCM